VISLTMNDIVYVLGLKRAISSPKTTMTQARQSYMDAVKKVGSMVNATRYLFSPKSDI
jgi:hypothetical protein